MRYERHIFIVVMILCSFVMYGQSPIVITQIHSVQKQLVAENCKYIIRGSINLKGDTLNVPKNSILCFEGGSLSNGQLVYNDTYIDGLPKINCKCSGTVTNDKIDLRYYGAQLNGMDDTEAFQQTINSVPEHSVVYLPAGKKMMLKSKIVIDKNLNLEINGTICLLDNGSLSFGTKDKIIELNEFKIHRIIGDGPKGNCIALDMVNARFNNFNIVGIQDVKYAIAFNLQEQSQSIGQNIFTFNQIYNCDKGIYFHQFDTFDKAVWAEGNQFMAGFLGKCNIGLEIERNIKAGCTIYQGCIDCMEVENSHDIVDNSNTQSYHMPNLYICNFVRKKTCILPSQATMIETQSGITTQGFITSHSGVECTSRGTGTYFGAGCIEIIHPEHPYIDFKTDANKDRDSRLISTEDSLTIQVGQSTKNNSISRTFKKNSR